MGKNEGARMGREGIDGRNGGMEGRGREKKDGMKGQERKG